jgi:hypothetical protein
MFATVRAQYRISRHGKVYKISRRRLFRQQLRRWLGYLPRATRPQPPRKTPTKDRFTWLSVAERHQIAALTRQGWSGRAIAKVMRRDRRSIDRARVRIR